MGMPRACSVRRWLGGAAAHLFSASVNVGGSQVEKLGRHCRSEAVRGLVACWSDILKTQPAATRAVARMRSAVNEGVTAARDIRASTYLT